MSNEQVNYEKAKQTLVEIRYALDTQPLTAVRRQELEQHASKLSGVLLSPWLPASGGRRIIMLGIVLLGIQQAWAVQNYEPFLWWLLLPCFSPRVVGECAYFFGVLKRTLHLS